MRDLDETEDIVVELDSASLLIYDRPQGTVQIHAVLRSYLEREDVPARLWHSELIAALGRQVRAVRSLPVRRYSYHAEHAGLTGELRDLVNIAWRDHSARVTSGPYAFAEDLARAALI